MGWLINMFGTSDYLERDPKRKFDVGLAHAFGGVVLIVAHFSMPVVLLGYFIKEVAFDLARVFKGDRSKWAYQIWTDRWLVADSIIDWCFWYLGAATVAHWDVRYSFAALIVGSAYFIAGKLRDDL